VRSFKTKNLKIKPIKTSGLPRLTARNDSLDRSPRNDSPVPSLREAKRRGNPAKKNKCEASKPSVNPQNQKPQNQNP